MIRHFSLILEKEAMSDNTLKTFKEYFELYLLQVKVKFSNFVDYLRVIANYYSDPAFLKLDSYLVFSYLFNNPFSISKRFLMLRGEKDVYTYGETPLTTLEHIAKECRISVKDVVYELGCGRGRTCFWLNRFVGCSVVGVDYVPEFIKRATAVKQKFDVKGVQFRLEDIQQTDLTGATVLYLYGTCYSTPFIEKLIKKIAALPRGTKIITVSYSLSEYTKDPIFEVIKRFPARFTWGTADVYLQIKQ